MYRLYPTKEQQEQLNWTLARCCELYNASLQERKEAWKYARKSISYVEQSRSFTEIRNSIRPEYQQIGSHVTQNVLQRVEKAYKAFFRRVKAGQTPGYPRYRSSKRYDSLCFPDQAGWKLEGKRLSITHIGSIKVKLHRPVEGTIKTVTIKREGQHWYASFVCELEREAFQRLSYTDDAIGIDLGLLHFATLSSGDTIENPRYYRQAEQKLKAAQQALARKKRGSKRRRRAVQRVAKCHRKVRNQRQDWLHKQSRQLVDTYELICFEDLAPSNMSRAPKPKQDENGVYLPNGASAKAGLNKSINDAGWSTFITFCQFKAECAGTVRVVKVNPYKTSQICSECGVVGKHKDLSERWHQCDCGASLDRDHNAARNVLTLGLQILQKEF
jgi:putative transposase